MAENKKSFILYSDQKELFDTLSDENAGKLIKHIFSYVNDEHPKNEDELINLLFIPIKQHLKRDLVKFEARRKQRSEAGKRSAEARSVKKRSTKSTSVKKRSTKSTDNVNDNDNDNDNVNVNDNVILKEKEIETLKEKYGDKAYQWMISKLSYYKLSSGKVYQSDYGAINSWVVKEWMKEHPEQDQRQRTKDVRTPTF